MSSVEWLEECESAERFLDYADQLLHDEAIPSCLITRHAALVSDLEYSQRSGHMPPLHEILELVQTIQHVRASWEE